MRWHETTLRSPNDDEFEFRVCQYGPVYSMGGRENELLLKVAM